MFSRIDRNSLTQVIRSGEKHRSWYPREICVRYSSERHGQVLGNVLVLSSIVPIFGALTSRSSSGLQEGQNILRRIPSISFFSSYFQQALVGMGSLVLGTRRAVVWNLVPCRIRSLSPRFPILSRLTSYSLCYIFFASRLASKTPEHGLPGPSC